MEPTASGNNEGAVPDPREQARAAQTRSQCWDRYVTVHAVALVAVAAATEIRPRVAPAAPMWCIADAFEEVVMYALFFAAPISVVLTWKALRRGGWLLLVAGLDVVLSILHWTMLALASE